MDTEEQLKKGEERREAYRTKTERLTDKPDTASLHPPVQHNPTLYWTANTVWVGFKLQSLQWHNLIRSNYFNILIWEKSSKNLLKTSSGDLCLTWAWLVTTSVCVTNLCVIEILIKAAIKKILCAVLFSQQSNFTWGNPGKPWMLSIALSSYFQMKSVLSKSQDSQQEIKIKR